LEIERKFVLESPPPRERLGEPHEIEQLYLLESDAELRIRRIGADTLMTVKSQGGLVRHEWETEIPRWVFDALAPAAIGRISKRRYRVADDAGTLEIDEYGNSLQGLWTVECEFASAEMARNFEAPAWLGATRDVTDDRAYKNRQLAVSGHPTRRREQ